ncbi:MAG: hypothetical protein GX165_04080, partial [Firmicutes bacterium]|nr:hypothetical protein [Bacillota bacterium]
MTSRERVLCALKNSEPDRVPYFEHDIDEVIVAQLLGRPVPDKLQLASSVSRSVEDEKAVSRILKRDNIAYLFPTPIFADKGQGLDGRLFYGEGHLRTEADLDKMSLPDP